MNEVLDLFELLIRLEVTGSIVDDITVGLVFSEAVIESGKINCDVNIVMIKDAALRAKMMEEADEVYHRLLERCRELKTIAFKMSNHS
mgnify:CR=1 FL=1